MAEIVHWRTKVILLLAFLIYPSVLPLASSNCFSGPLKEDRITISLCIGGHQSFIHKGDMNISWLLVHFCCLLSSPFSQAPVYKNIRINSLIRMWETTWKISPDSNNHEAIHLNVTSTLIACWLLSSCPWVTNPKTKTNTGISKMIWTISCFCYIVCCRNLGEHQSRKPSNHENMHVWYSHFAVSLPICKYLEDCWSYQFLEY